MGLRLPTGATQVAPVGQGTPVKSTGRARECQPAASAESNRLHHGPRRWITFRRESRFVPPLSTRPEGATGNSQGREPLDRPGSGFQAPTGRHDVATSACVAPLGLCRLVRRRVPGVCTPGYYLPPLRGFISRATASGVTHQASGIRHQESGVRGQESGVRSQGSGVRGQESEVRSQESGVSSQQSDSRLLAPNFVLRSPFSVLRSPHFRSRLPLDSELYPFALVSHNARPAVSLFRRC